MRKAHGSGPSSMYRRREVRVVVSGTVLRAHARRRESLSPATTGVVFVIQIAWLACALPTITRKWSKTKISLLSAMSMKWTLYVVSSTSCSTRSSFIQMAQAKRCLSSCSNRRWRLIPSTTWMRRCWRSTSDTLVSPLIMLLVTLNNLATFSAGAICHLRQSLRNTSKGVIPPESKRLSRLEELIIWISK